MSDLSRGLMQMLDDSNFCVDEIDKEKAIDIPLAIIDVLSRIIDKTDYSSGRIGNFIEYF